MKDTAGATTMTTNPSETVPGAGATALKEKPYKGQMFGKLEDGVAFYREYARRIGFDIRMSTTKKVQDRITWRYVLCNREGVKFVTPEEEIVQIDQNNPKIRRRVSARCGCNTKVVFKYVAFCGYEIHIFDEEYNHDMVEPEHRQYMKINRKIDPVHQKFILDCAKANIGATTSHRLLAELMGGKEFVGCSVAEVQNFARDMKAFVGGCDAQMLLNDMQKRKQLCESFRFDYDVDSEDKLTKLFWCDPTSQRNYHRFGQVVAFDTTYSTNKYCMIFAPFTGIDNHGKPVTFAAGLLTKEDAASFGWLFQKFIACMGKPPTMIITDQDLGMKVAVESELQGTRHRWCMWHIMLKVADKISKELRADEEFKKELNACVWSEVIEPEYFEACWSGIMAKFGLIGDHWFDTMFENRRCWVPAYFRDLELSGLLRTTSISECENSFYKRYTRCKSNLLEFWMHYNTALETQRYHNSRMNYIDKNYVPSLCTDMYIEKHAARNYTTKFFMHVQEQIKAAQSGDAIFEIFVDEGKESYKIVDVFKEEYVVIYVEAQGEYSCTCKLFKRMRYQCSHVICVMKNKFVQTIPEKYIIERWKKSHLIKVAHDIEINESNHFGNVEDNRMWVNRITTSMHGWLQKFDGDADKLAAFQTAIDAAGLHIAGENHIQGNADKNQILEEFYGAEIPKIIEVHPPENVKTKGSGSRLISRKEKVVRQKEKPLRRCNKCKQMAHHDARNCDKEPK